MMIGKRSISHILLLLCMIIPQIVSFLTDNLNVVHSSKVSFPENKHTGAFLIKARDFPTRSFQLHESDKGDPSDFSFEQRIESLKTLVVGALAGGIALTPFAALHDIVLGGDFVRNGPAQWEFDTDMGSIEAGLFAIVYRYCVRQDDNPMLKQGVIGAFALTRILSKIQVPTSCSYAPLSCGEPLEYFNWDMLQQAGLSGVESAALFAAAAAAMEYSFSRNIISKFRN